MQIYVVRSSVIPLSAVSPISVRLNRSNPVRATHFPRVQTVWPQSPPPPCPTSPLPFPGPPDRTEANVCFRGGVPPVHLEPWPPWWNPLHWVRVSLQKRLKMLARTSCWRAPVFQVDSDKIMSVMDSWSCNVGHKSCVHTTVSRNS